MSVAQAWVGKILPGIAFFTCFLAANVVLAEEEQAKEAEEAVSYYRQIRPILQRSCSGCHQPAKAGGKLLLTSYEGLKAGGENGVGFEPGKPDDSVLIDYISGEEPLMPQKGDPLSEEQVNLISLWITQGANDDTPHAAQATINWRFRTQDARAKLHRLYPSNDRLTEY